MAFDSADCHIPRLCCRALPSYVLLRCVDQDSMTNSTASDAYARVRCALHGAGTLSTHVELISVGASDRKLLGNALERASFRRALRFWRLLLLLPAGKAVFVGAGMLSLQLAGWLACLQVPPWPVCWVAVVGCGCDVYYPVPCICPLLALQLRGSVK